jgi:hypothetical protein
LNCLADPDVRASIESLYRQYRRHYVGRPSEPGSPPTAKSPHVHKITHRLDADTVDRLVTDYTGGMKAADVATRYGISKDAALDYSTSGASCAPGARTRLQ